MKDNNIINFVKEVSEKNYSEIFNTLVEDLISLRNQLRDNKKFEESDNIRNLLEKLNIVIEDDKESSNWSFKDL
jgi:cysteinyl-tRNA synthetase